MRTTDEIIHNGKTLTEILRLHRSWLSNNTDGVRAILDGASLEGASLEGARLDGASLVGARLNRASLEGAILDGASLEGASLNRASLVGASLNRASLEGASLEGAILDGASLEGASLNRASLVGASLNRAKYKGIEIKHFENMNGLYRYNVVACVSTDDTDYIGLGCHFKKASDWEGDGFWNNLSEFPNDGSVHTKKRQMALRLAKEFLELYRENRK
jgi:uncharacterized protein YjbI with pentapeptide repeats